MFNLSIIQHISKRPGISWISLVILQYVIHANKRKTEHIFMAYTINKKANITSALSINLP